VDPSIDQGQEGGDVEGRDWRGNPVLHRLFDREGVERQGGSMFGEQDLIANVGGLVSAGQDTTSFTLTWALYLLAKYPEVQSKLREEVDRVTTGSDVTETEVSQLKYLENIFNETLRLKPVVPILPFHSNEEFTTAAGTVIAKDTSIAVDVYHLHTYEKYWENPLVFDPSRWDREVPPCFFPFGGGPRICLGRFLARFEFTIVLAKLVQNYTWTVPENEPEPEEWLALTLGVKGGKLNLQFTERKS